MRIIEIPEDSKVIKKNDKSPKGKLVIDENKKQRDIILFKKFMQMNYYRVKAINEIISEPKEHEQFRIITFQSFNGFSILLWLIEKYKYEEVYLTTFSLDDKTSKALIDLVESTPETNYTLLITSLLKYDRKQRQQDLIECANKRHNFKFIETYNHTKIIMAKSGDKHFIIEGSGNLSANARIEQYLFENSKETYMFHKAWIDDILQLSAKKDTVIYGNNA